MSYTVYTNSDGVAQLRGTVVRRTGVGTCVLAKADAPANWAGVVGTRYGDVAAGSSGFVVGFQDGCQVRLEAAAPSGSAIYLSATTAGLGTHVAPASPVLKQSLAQVALVTNYGADPTGTIDSQPAFAACLTANGYAFVPAGTYLLNSEVVVGTNRTAIFGEAGSVLKKGADNMHAIRCTASYCRFAGFEIDGNSKTGASGIFITGAYNTVAGCLIHDCAGVIGHGICLDGQATTCSSNLVLGNHVYSVGGIGISQNKVIDSRIEGNLVRSTQLEGVTVDNQSYRSNVLGNRIANTCLSGGAAAISLDYSDLSSISSNIISGGTKPGIKSNNNLGATNYVVVSGNLIVVPATYGIHLFAGIGGTASNWIISGNLVRDALTAWCCFDAGCDNNEARYNQKSGLATSDAGAGNTY